MTTEALLPCPFCGAEIHEVDMAGADFGEPEWQLITCPRCATTSGASANKKLLIERWNTRALQSPIPGGWSEAIEAAAKVAESHRWSEATEAKIAGESLAEAFTRTLAAAIRNIPPPGSAQVEREEVGWLIERENGDGLVYAMSSRWDRDSNKALRFSREVDALAFARANSIPTRGNVTSGWCDFTRVAEHRWG